MRFKCGAETINEMYEPGARRRSESVAQNWKSGSGAPAARGADPRVGVRVETVPELRDDVEVIALRAAVGAAGERGDAGGPAVVCVAVGRAPARAPRGRVGANGEDDEGCREGSDEVLHGKGSGGVNDRCETMKELVPVGPGWVCCCVTPEASVFCPPKKRERSALL